MLVKFQSMKIGPISLFRAIPIQTFVDADIPSFINPMRFLVVNTTLAPKCNYYKSPSVARNTLCVGQNHPLTILEPTVSHTDDYTSDLQVTN